jgi:hypothetical protein
VHEEDEDDDEAEVVAPVPVPKAQPKKATQPKKAGAK